MDKIIKDDKVAVLVSPSYGGGWSTWNRDTDHYTQEQLIFCPELVTAVLAGSKPEEIFALAKSLFPELYLNGLRGSLEIEWVPVGAKFRIAEYDGSESVELFDDVDWLIA